MQTNCAPFHAKLAVVQKHLAAGAPPVYAGELASAIANGSKALEEYEAWIRERRPTMIDFFPVGREAYIHFLRTTALNPFSPEEMLLMGRMEFQRGVTSEALELRRQLGMQDPPLFPTVDAQIPQAQKDEIAIREFLESRTSSRYLPGCATRLSNSGNKMVTVAFPNVSDPIRTKSCSMHAVHAHFPPRERQMPP